MKLAVEIEAKVAQAKQAVDSLVASIKKVDQAAPLARLLRSGNRRSSRTWQS
jgi:hypothetical protein